VARVGRPPGVPGRDLVPHAADEWVTGPGRRHLARWRRLRAKCPRTASASRSTGPPPSSAFPSSTRCKRGQCFARSAQRPIVPGGGRRVVRAEGEPLGELKGNSVGRAGLGSHNPSGQALMQSSSYFWPSGRWLPASWARMRIHRWSTTLRSVRSPCSAAASSMALA